MKKCKSCGEIKSEKEYYFNIQNSTKDKLSVRCKKCHNTQARRWRENNPNFMKEYALKNRKDSKVNYGISVKTIERHGLEVALAAYDRARRKCELCGKINDLTIHHKDNNGRNKMDVKEFANNDLNNLQILCRSCHGRIHSLEKQKKYGQGRFAVV